MQKLVDTVRTACLPGLWSQGVKLARDGAVVPIEQKPDEVTVRVRVPVARVPPTVTLYPEDLEWSCDCGGRVDPCEHVAAAAIAAAQGFPAKEEPADDPDSGPGEPASLFRSRTPLSTAIVAPTPPRQALPSGHLRYELGRATGALELRRFVVAADGKSTLLTTSLASGLVQGGGGLMPTHEDLVVDRFVSGRRPGYFPAGRMVEVFAALGSSDVVFEGRKVRVSSERIGPRAELIDDAGTPGGPGQKPREAGVALVIDRDPRVSEVVVAGVVLCGDQIHPMAETDVTGDRLEKLPFRRYYPKGELGTLVSEVLPGLERRMAVEIRSSRLPRKRSRARPRIAFAVDQREHTLSVVPTLVYGDPPEARIDDGKLVHLGGGVPQRDDGAERALLARLRDELHLIPGRRVDFDGAEAVRFAQRLEGWRDEGGGSGLRVSGALVPQVRVGDRSFEIDFVVSGDIGGNGRDGDDIEGVVRNEAGERVISAEAVLRAWETGLPVIPLAGGGFADMPRGWLDKHGARVTDLLAARRDDGTVEAAARPGLAELCDDLEMPRPPGLSRLAPLFEAFEALPETPLPDDLTATLRPYQKRGVDWLVFLRDAELGAILADDMGLGKTLQTLCALRGRTLVVCPRSVIHNWGDEIRRFRPGLRHALFHGPRRQLDPKADVTLTTYAVLRLDAELLAAQSWDVVVLDEAQAIKNPDSQVTRAAYELSATFRVALSGTPVENRLAELWSLMHFTNRGLLAGRRSFEERFERPIAAGTPGAAASLRGKVRPFVLRRLKRDVAPELPPRTDAVLYVELEESERNVYDAVRAATDKDVVARLAEGGSVLAALEALLRLRQAACHSALVPGQHAETSSKVERLVEALEEAVADGHKALVFSQWTSFLNLVEPHLERAGIPFSRLDGSTRDRAGVVGEFQSEGGPPVMLVSLKAGGTGLNLTAADHVFMLDPWWNPAVEDQAKDRAHRIGQDKPVFVYRLVAKDTVEEGILALQERKRGLADAALGEADQAGGLTRDDLLALLR